MADVYQNACFMIAAAHPSSSQTPLLTLRKILYSTSISFDFDNTKVGARRVSPQARLPLDMRGWTLQEEYLSNRIFRSTDHELVWRCRLVEECECDAHDLSRRPSSSMPKGQSFNDLRNLWPDIVTEYLTRQLSFAREKLPTLAGIAAVIHRNDGSQYVAGFWTDDILKEICWEPSTILNISDDDNQPPFYGGPRLAICEYRAPSFSWASVEWRVELPTTHRSRNWGWCEAILHNVATELRGQSQFGEVVDGYLVLESPVINLTLICEECSPTLESDTRGDADDIPYCVGASGKTHNYYLIQNGHPSN